MALQILTDMRVADIGEALNGLADALCGTDASGSIGGTCFDAVEVEMDNLADRLGFMRGTPNRPTYIRKGPK